jgi:hypothetical protein
MTSDTIAKVIVLLIGGSLVWALWRAAQPKLVFAIRVIEGKPQVVKGTVTPAFLDRIAEVAAANKISHGTVRGFARGTFIRLRFSAETTDDARQQLRNWWATFGWSMPAAV